MLTPDARTVLLEDLRAPDGYTLDHAVTTTFTLDLTAAMLPPFAFADIGIGSSRPDPISMLQSLRRAGSKVDIFCQAGAIGVPRSADLVAFLEPMVHQVVPPTGGLFHPKCWFLRFASPDREPRHRLLVLSRNLTHDNTWDIAARLDSVSLGDHDIPRNEPLARFLRWLPTRLVHPLGPERVDRISRLADEIDRVHWEWPEHSHDLQFHTVGVPGSPEIDLSGNRRLVISPFVTADGLERIGRGGHGTILISRQESLDLLPDEALFGVSAWTLAPDTAIPNTP